MGPRSSPQPLSKHNGNLISDPAGSLTNQHIFPVGIHTRITAQPTWYSERPLNYISNDGIAKPQLKNLKGHKVKWTSPRQGARQGASQPTTSKKKKKKKNWKGVEAVSKRDKQSFQDIKPPASSWKSTRPCIICIIKKPHSELTIGKYFMSIFQFCLSAQYLFSVPFLFITTPQLAIFFTFLVRL